MARILLEMAILSLSVCILPVQLRAICLQYYKKVRPEPSFIFFALHLLVSSLWVILAVTTGQYFILMTSCNNILSQSCIIFMMLKIRKDKADELLRHDSAPPDVIGQNYYPLHHRHDYKHICGGVLSRDAPVHDGHDFIMHT